MPSVLTEGSVVLCGPLSPTAHGGKVKIQGIAKLYVNGQPVLTKTGIVGQAIDPTQPCQTKVNAAGNHPCASVTNLTGGEATKLFVGGIPVMLDTVSGNGLTEGKPPGTLVAQANQLKLTAI